VNEEKRQVPIISFAINDSVFSSTIHVTRSMVTSSDTSISINTITTNLQCGEAGKPPCCTLVNSLSTTARTTVIVVPVDSSKAIWKYKIEFEVPVEINRP
jgi:hypothetical protein